MKKFIFALWIICVLLLAILSVNYINNKKLISKYDMGQYEQNKLSALGITEPYIAPYNNGNAYYNQGKFEDAIKQYNKALKSNPPKKRECKIRINKTLAMLQLIDFDNIDESNIDEIINKLEDAKAVLMEKGCADDIGSGHDKDAQKLKDEIDELEEALRNGGSSGDSGNNDPNTDPPPEKPDEITSEINRKKIEELENETQKERDRQRGREVIFEFDLYHGDEW